MSPLVAGPWEIGPDQGVATFYRYLPDLPIVQLMLPRRTHRGAAGRPGPARRLRRPVATPLRRRRSRRPACWPPPPPTVLAGTGRLDPHGMIAIPALHNPAHDRPVSYTPTCSDTLIPVCLHPAYTVYLPSVTAALEPVLGELAGLPGAPVRIDQKRRALPAGAGNGVDISRCRPGHDRHTANPPHTAPHHAGRVGHHGELATQLRTSTARDILNNVIGGERRETSDAQRAVAGAILRPPPSRPIAPTAIAGATVRRPAARYPARLAHAARGRAAGRPDHPRAAAMTAVAAGEPPAESARAVLAPGAAARGQPSRPGGPGRDPRLRRRTTDRAALAMERLRCTATAADLRNRVRRRHRGH